MAEFQRVNNLARTETERGVDGHGMEKWTAPEEGWHKANFDAARDISQGRMGLGIVIRDNMGRVIAARSISMEGWLEPYAMEAQAACHAVRLCKEVGLNKLILEGDAKTLVTAVNEKEASMHKHGHIIEDIKLELQSFTVWKCCFVSRNFNKAAHGLAQVACKQLIGGTWNSSIPRAIRDIVLMEQSVSI